MRGASWVCLALLAVGCNSPEQDAARRTADQAEAKLVEVQKRRQALLEERKTLAARLQQLLSPGNEGGRDVQRALAAAAYLDNDEASPARAGFELEQALARNDLSLATALAERASEGAWRCEVEGRGANDDPWKCDVAKFEDECAGVENRVPASPRWSCTAVVPGAEGVPATAFCTAAVTYPAAHGEHPSSFAEALDGTSLTAERDLIRTAFFHEGRLHVADHPAPVAEVYSPPNTEALMACAQGTSANECRYQCDQRFGRYQDPCGEGEMGEDGDAEGEEHEEGEDESDEPSEVRQAREDAHEKQLEAERAQAEADAAQKEVEYQECNADCTGVPDLGGEPVLAPVSARIAVRFERSPAPGVFLVQADKTYSSATGAALGLRTFTWVVQSDELVTLGSGGKLAVADPAKPTLEGLRLIAEFEDDRVAAMARPDAGEATVEPSKGRGVAWTTWPETGDPLLVGFENGKAVAGVVIPGKKGAARVSGEKVCRAIEASKLPAAFGKACSAKGAP